MCESDKISEDKKQKKEELQQLTVDTVTQVNDKGNQIQNSCQPSPSGNIIIIF